MPIINTPPPSLGGLQLVDRTFSYLSPELQPEGAASLELPLGVVLLYKISFSHPARLRLYSSNAARNADATRPLTTQALPGRGILLEMVSSTNLAFELSPVVWCPNRILTPALLANLHSEAAEISVIFHYLELP